MHRGQLHCQALLAACSHAGSARTLPVLLIALLLPLRLLLLLLLLLHCQCQHTTVPWPLLLRQHQTLHAAAAHSR